MMKLLHDTQSILSRPKEAYFKREVKVEKAIKSEYLKAKEKGKTSMKKTFSFGHGPNEGGGVYPCPNFLALFLKVHFWSIKRVYFFKNANVLNF